MYRRIRREKENRLRRLLIKREKKTSKKQMDNDIYSHIYKVLKSVILIIIQTLICYNRNNIARKTNKILAVFSLVTVIAEIKQTRIKMELEITTIIIKVQ